MTQRRARIVTIAVALLFATRVEARTADAVLQAAIDGNEPVVEQPAGPPPTPEHTGFKAMLKGLVTDVKHLPSRTNALVAVIGAGGALAVHPEDDEINQHLVGNSTAARLFTPGRVIGATPTLLGAAVGIYAVGRLNDKPKVSHLGMDLIRSIAISQALTQGLKYATRRERPDGSGPTSFPSGHASDTFAFATALERHLGWRGAVPAYLVASYVAASRLHENRHFASDVVFGAAVGIIAGRTVTRHGRDDYSATVQFRPGGAAILFVRHASN